MARLARAEVFSPEEVAVVYVMSRVLRRCFLMGDDPLTGKNCDHRRLWGETLLKRFAAGFGIDLLGFAILSSHAYLILRSQPDVVQTWDDTEVARRWLLCPIRCVALNRAGGYPSGHPGRRFAAIAAALCPGLICGDLSGRGGDQCVGTDTREFQTHQEDKEVHSTLSVK